VYIFNNYGLWSTRLNALCDCNLFCVSLLLVMNKEKTKFRHFFEVLRKRFFRADGISVACHLLGICCGWIFEAGRMRAFLRLTVVAGCSQKCYELRTLKDFFHTPNIADFKLNFQELSKLDPHHLQKSFSKNFNAQFLKKVPSQNSNEITVIYLETECAAENPEPSD
jgi:hypothetical protein